MTGVLRMSSKVTETLQPSHYQRLQILQDFLETKNDELTYMLLRNICLVKFFLSSKQQILVTKFLYLIFFF